MSASAAPAVNVAALLNVHSSDAPPLGRVPGGVSNPQPTSKTTTTMPCLIGSPTAIILQADRPAATIARRQLQTRYRSHRARVCYSALTNDVINQLSPRSSTTS